MSSPGAVVGDSTVVLGRDPREVPNEPPEEPSDEVPEEPPDDCEDGVPLEPEPDTGSILACGGAGDAGP